MTFESCHLNDYKKYNSVTYYSNKQIWGDCRWFEEGSPENNKMIDVDRCLSMCNFTKIMNFWRKKIGWEFCLMVYNLQKCTSKTKKRTNFVKHIPSLTWEKISESVRRILAWKYFCATHAHDTKKFIILPQYKIYTHMYAYPAWDITREIRPVFMALFEPLKIKIWKK